MALLDLLALLITATALFAWINERWLKLPTTIGVMVLGMAASLVLIALDHAGVGIARRVEDALAAIDFNTVLMHGMLSFLLFAGALHVNLADLARHRVVIGTLATFGVVLSAIVIAALTHFGFGLLGIELPWVVALIFGALISPTDPIAVLAILRRCGVAHSIEVKITGESLFNDGVGVVLFLLLLGVIAGTADLSVAGVSLLFAKEAIGGALFGIALGWAAYVMLTRVDNYKVEVLVTLAVVMGGYAAATALHVSGPIAIVIAGLMIGNHGRKAMSETTREHIDTFWELVDEILNAVLFVLIGVEVLLITPEPVFLVAGLVAIPIVLLGRAASVGLPIRLMALRRSFPPGTLRVLIWGGLRGGVSVALALSLPHDLAERNLLITVTYCVVVFSILVQGLTLSRVVASGPQLPRTEEEAVAAERQH